MYLHTSLVPDAPTWLTSPLVDDITAPKQPHHPARFHNYHRELEGDRLYVLATRYLKLFRSTSISSIYHCRGAANAGTHGSQGPYGIKADFL